MCNGTTNLSFSPVVLIHHDKMRQLYAYTPTIVSCKGLRQHRDHSCIIFSLKSATHKMCVAAYFQRCLDENQDFTAVYRNQFLRSFARIIIAYEVKQYNASRVSVVGQACTCKYYNNELILVGYTFSIRCHERPVMLG